MDPPRDRPLRGAAAAAAAVFTFLVATSDLSGIAWDEGTLWYAGDRRLAWVGEALRSPRKVLEEDRFRAAWGLAWDESVNPPLWPAISAGARAALGDLLGAVRAGRVPQALAAAALAFSFVRLAGPAAGAAAALGLLLMPRLVGHMRLAALDLPLAAAWWFAVRPCLEPAPTRRGAVVAGLGLGLAVATKLSAPVLAVAWIAAVAIRRPPARWIATALATAAGAAALGLAPLLLRPRLLLEHVEAIPRLIQANTFYLGRSWLEIPPWHYPWAYLAATTPALTLLLAIAGAAGARRDAAGRIAVVQALALPAALSLPWAPKYDAERLFVPALPWIAYLAARGLAEVAGRPTSGRAVSALVAVYALGTLGLHAARPLAYFSEAVGGAAGAWRLGLEVSYWGEALDRAFWEAVPRVPRIHATALGEAQVRAAVEAGWAPGAAYTFGQEPPAGAEVWIVHFRRGLLGPAIPAALASWREVRVVRAGLGRRGPPLAAILVRR